MATTTKHQTQKEWLKATLKNIADADKKESFYMRVTGLMVGTCPMTVGYIGKSEFMGKFTYYACKELVNIFQSWQYHCVYCPEINKGIASKAQKFAAYKPEHKILETSSLQKAIEFLKLEEHGVTKP